MWSWTIHAVYVHVRLDFLKTIFFLEKLYTLEWLFLKNSFQYSYPINYCHQWTTTLLIVSQSTFVLLSPYSFLSGTVRVLISFSNAKRYFQWILVICRHPTQFAVTPSMRQIFWWLQQTVMQGIHKLRDQGPYVKRYTFLKFQNKNACYFRIFSDLNSQ